MIGAATAMATKRAARRRTTTPGRKVAPPDLGTEQTRARLQPPPWADWPRELQEAAEAIDLAVRLLAGASMAQAQLLGRIRHTAIGDASVWEERLLRRYTWWRWEIARKGWLVGRLLPVIVEAAPCGDLDGLKAALDLYARAPRHVA